MATERQKNAASKVLENGGNVSKAMRDAGYSDKTAKTPKNLTESDGWNELMDKNFPDELLQKVLNEGLLADKAIGIEGNTIEDYPTRHKYLDTAMKLRDRYPAQKKAVDLTSKGEKMQTIINIIKPTE